ncbi:uncharacterized protein [Dermacentor albipictus]|uniref:uncharacterized protein n=1 Tax=Dermacentor albipictus TaxID=60249 RepID=UPI0031FD0EF0
MDISSRDSVIVVATFCCVNNFVIFLVHVFPPEGRFNNEDADHMVYIIGVKTFESAVSVIVDIMTIIGVWGMDKRTTTSRKQAHGYRQRLMARLKEPKRALLIFIIWSITTSPASVGTDMVYNYHTSGSMDMFIMNAVIRCSIEAAKCINCAGLIFYSGGLIRDKRVMGRTLGYGWIFDLLFSLECALNGLSDLLLLAAVSYRSRDAREGFPIGCLTCTLKGFIVWNTFSVVACWTASCALYHERDLEFGAVYPYALINESVLTSNATSATLVNKSFIPTLAMVYISATLIAAFKLIVLYAVYYGFLQVALHDAVLADPFVVYAREQDTTHSSLHTAPAGGPEDGRGYHGGGRADHVRPPGLAGRIPKEWGQPSQTSFRPRPEWSSSEGRHNPFAESRDHRLAGLQVVSSSQSSYPLDRWTSPGRMCSPDMSSVSVTERAATDPGSPSVAHMMPLLPCGPAGSTAGPPAHQPTAQPSQLPPHQPALPAGPPMPPPSPTPLAPSPAPPHSSPDPVPSAMPQPHHPDQQQPAASTPSFPPVDPHQAPSLVKVNDDAPPPRDRKRHRRVSISEEPSDTAAGAGGAAQATTGSGQPSARRSNESLANTLGRMLDNLAAGPSQSR